MGGVAPSAIPLAPAPFYDACTHAFVHTTSLYLLLCLSFSSFCWWIGVRAVIPAKYWWCVALFIATSPLSRQRGRWIQIARTGELLSCSCLVACLSIQSLPTGRREAIASGIRSSFARVHAPTLRPGRGAPTVGRPRDAFLRSFPAFLFFFLFFFVCWFIEPIYFSIVLINQYTFTENLVRFQLTYRVSLLFLFPFLAILCTSVCFAGFTKPIRFTDGFIQFWLMVWYVRTWWRQITCSNNRPQLT